MPWHYRPCRIINPIDGTEHWDIREYYYGSETVNGWSANSARPIGDTQEELKSSLQMMIDDITRREVLTLYVYTCEKCKQEDARTEKDRTICEECLMISSNSPPETES